MARENGRPVTKNLPAVRPQQRLAPFPEQYKAAGGSGVTFVGAPNWRQIIRLDSYVDPDAEELTRNIAMATSAYAYTAIMYRASRVGEPPLYVAEETDEGEVVIADHEFSMLLDEPSADYDMGELQQLTEIYRLITGAALWVKQVDLADRPAGWVPFSGDEFTTRPANGRIYGLFLVDTKDGRRTYTPDQVVHFRDLNPSSWRNCLSKLDVALAQLDLGHQVNRTVRNFMRKAMFPGGLISPDKDWNPDDPEWEAWKAEIEAWHAGPANAGAPLVLQGGTTFSKSNAGLKELLPTEILDRIEATVGSVFGIPPVVLGWKVGLENSPWSQMGEARQMTYEDTIEPRWRDVEKKMSRQILSKEDREAGRSIKYDTSMVRALMADDQLRASVAASMREEWTRDERRVYTGQEPLGEDDPRGAEIGSSTSTFDFGENGAVSAGMSVLVRQGKTIDQKSLEWAIFDLATKAAESTWERIVAQGLTTIRNDILKLVDEHLEEKTVDPELETKQIDTDSTISFIAVVGDYIREKADPLLQQLTLPLVVSTGTTALKRAAAQTGLSFSVLQPGLLVFAEEESAFLASVMGDTTGKQVADLVQAQLNEGGSVASIRKALQESAAFSRTRAQLVARTETTRAWNGAQKRSLAEWVQEQPEGVRVRKTWITSRDNRVRSAHQQLDGETVELDDTFTNGLAHPGEPNCRCTTSYEVISPSN